MATEHHWLPRKAGRVLRCDGDGLAYYCSGSSNTSREQAGINLYRKVAAAKEVCGAERVEILLTARASDKGGRYAVARVKPYQGQRHSHKPENWEYVRTILERGMMGADTIEATDAEADDLFGIRSGWDDVIYTQDKDMQMLPGIHLNWDTHRMLQTSFTEFCVEWNDKVYGEKWFWLQMLHGDTADNIPGLPFYANKVGKPVRCGEVAAHKMLAGATDSIDAMRVVSDLYHGYYGSEWDIQLAEQAVLLWMRRRSVAWDDVFRFGPLIGWEGSVAYHEVRQRIEEARSYGQDQGQ